MSVFGISSVIEVADCFLAEFIVHPSAQLLGALVVFLVMSTKDESIFLPFVGRARPAEDTDKGRSGLILVAGAFYLLEDEIAVDLPG